MPTMFREIKDKLAHFSREADNCFKRFARETEFLGQISLNMKSVYGGHQIELGGSVMPLVI